MKYASIYTLECPITGEIKYVGKTTLPLKERLQAHLYIYSWGFDILNSKGLSGSIKIPVSDRRDVITVSVKRKNAQARSKFKDYGINFSYHVDKLIEQISAKNRVK